MVKSVEDILWSKVHTKELIPSQRRRLREIQLPDGELVRQQQFQNVKSFYSF